MQHFPILRTRRLSVELQELTIAQSLELAAMPPHLYEAGLNTFLNYAVKTVKAVDGVKSVSDWTVQERYFVMSHYLASTQDTDPNFAIGNAGHYLDYIDAGNDIPDESVAESAEVGGDIWHIRHLLGGMAMSIERLQGEINGISGRAHWLLGCMASQLVRAGETVPDVSASEGAFDEWLVERMRIFSAWPESDFIQMLNVYLDWRGKLSHLFNIECFDDGLIVSPKGGAASGLPPTRFSFRACLSDIAQALVG